MGVTRTQVVKFIRKGDKGEQGAVLRGPQAWSDCATGYAFQAGGVGDKWQDVVLYNNNYYNCRKNHTKTSTNYPGSPEANNGGYWQLGDKIDLVATKILLAQYALVKNLGVEAIEMKDANGNVLFQAKDGKVTCKTGTFEKVTVNGELNGVTGSFKSLKCIDASKETVSEITFDASGRLWFDGDMLHQGNKGAEQRTLRFYTANLWCRGAFGHRKKTIAQVVNNIMKVFTTDELTKYETVTLEKATNGTYYKIPLFSPNDKDAAGMPIDVVVIKSTSDYYYVFDSIGLGKEWRVVNGNDTQKVHFADIGGWHELPGGGSVSCVYISPDLLNPTPTGVGAGVFWSGETNLNW